MAKYEVKFSCGHTQIIELFGIEITISSYKREYGNLH